MAALVLAAGCSKKIDGPTPTVSGLTPAAVCQAQITTAVTLSGDGLSPLYVGALEDGKLELPSVTLAKVQDVAGIAASGPAFAVPDDPTDPVASHVRWTSQRSMAFDVFPALMLEPGLYDVDVKNSNGNTGSFPAGLLAVPPPTVSKLSSDLLCGGMENTLTIEGDFFVDTGAAKPQVILTQAGAAGAAPRVLATDTLGTCRALPGSSGLKACKQLTVKLLAGALPVGNYKVEVKNPDTVGCTSTEAFDLTIVPEPVISRLEPEAACSADNAVTVKVTGTGFLSVDGRSAGVMFGNVSLPGTVTATTCTPVMGPTETVTTCTELTFQIPKGTAGGTYPVAVRNPDPAGCTSNTKSFWLFDRPTIAKIEPGAACSAVNQAAVVLTGTGFVVAGATKPMVTIGNRTYTPMESNCTDVMGPTQALRVCTTLTVTLNPMDFTPGKVTVTVTNPPGIGCGTDGTAEIEITTPPDLQAVRPTSVCAGDATLVLSGTGFSANATVTINDVPAKTVTVNNAGTMATAAFGGGLTPGGPYDVTISNGAGCADTLADAVTVVPGPQIFFMDPEVAFNGLNLQATLYGSGFTNPVMSVEISLDGDNWTALTYTADAGKPNQVQVLIPKGTAPGTYDVRLTDSSGAGCKATLPDALVVTDETTVVLAMPAMKPGFGWTQESTGVTVSAAAAQNGFVAVPRVYLNPSNPGQTTVATALGAVSFLDATQLTALVPRGLPSGDYDLIVVNPDGTVGVATGAFKVTANPPPTITSLSPGTVPNVANQSVAVEGKNFRQPMVALSCVDSGGAPLGANPTATVSNPTTTSATITFDASMAGVACVVRLTNGDDGTYDDYSALVITNPAQNLYLAKAGPMLATGRRAPVMLDGHASNAARFVHVLGGDDGTASGPMDSIETSALSLLGVPQGFVANRSRLSAARSFAGGARIGRFLYIAGGFDGANPVATVERAAILDPDRRGEVVDLFLEIADTGLDPGVYYYRVASVMGANDPFNPSGENLPSDPFPVRVPQLPGKKLQITVIWKQDAGATKYRLYRSPTAGAIAGTERLLFETADGTTLRYKDVGGPPIAADTPLPVGSLGRFAALPSLASARRGPGVAIGADPADATKAYLYVMGGLAAPNNALATYEFLPLTLGADGSQTAAGAFVAGTQTLGAARWQIGAAAATSALSSVVPAGTTFIYAMGGVNAAGAIAREAEAAAVTAGGQLGAFVAINGAAGLASAGHFAVVAGNLAFAFGGNNATPSTLIMSGKLCNTCIRMGNSVGAPYVENLNAGQDMLEARYLLGGTLSGAIVYVAGGQGAAMPALRTTEYRLW